MSFIALFGFMHCMDKDFLQALDSFAEEKSIFIVLVDTKFDMRALNHSSRIVIFELCNYNVLNTLSPAAKPIGPSYISTDGYSEKVAQLAFRMAQRTLLRNSPTEDIIKLMCVLKEAFAYFARNLGNCLSTVCYDIPHSYYDFCVLNGITRKNNNVFYLRGTGLGASMKTLHRINGWSKSGERVPVTTGQLGLELDMVKAKQYASMLVYKDLSSQLPYDPSLAASLIQLYRHRKTQIKLYLDGYIDKLQYVACLKSELSYSAISPEESKRLLPRSIVYFLHREPEASTCPEAAPYISQIETIGELRNRIPPNIPLLIKEHPQTFTDWDTLVWGHIDSLRPWRTLEYYTEICSLPNTYILPLSLTSDVVLSFKPFAAATLTGSVYAEAALHEVPCLALADCAFSYLPFVADICGNDLMAEISEKRKFYSLSKEKRIDLIFKAVANYAVFANLRLHRSADEESGTLDRSYRIANMMKIIDFSLQDVHYLMPCQ